MHSLGNFLQRLAQNSRRIFVVYLLVLGTLAALNLFSLPEHPHFGLDAYPFFWPAFGLGTGLVMVLLVKKIVQPLIVRKEDHYHDC
jgi:hypothetical protein